MHMLRVVCVCVSQDILVGQAKFVDNHTIKYGLPGRVDVGGQVTAKDVIIATGSVPFVPPGVCVWGGGGAVSGLHAGVAMTGCNEGVQGGGTRRGKGDGRQQQCPCVAAVGDSQLYRAFGDMRIVFNGWAERLFLKGGQGPALTL
jgi:hypothetical protein